MYEPVCYRLHEYQLTLLESIITLNGKEGNSNEDGLTQLDSYSQLCGALSGSYYMGTFLSGVQVAPE